MGRIGVGFFVISGEAELAAEGLCHQLIAEVVRVEAIGGHAPGRPRAGLVPWIHRHEVAFGRLTPDRAIGHLGSGRHAGQRGDDRRPGKAGCQVDESGLKPVGLPTPDKIVRADATDDHIGGQALQHR